MLFRRLLQYGDFVARGEREMIRERFMRIMGVYVEG